MTGRARAALARAWAWLRAVSGDDAYEAYAAHAAGAPLPSREEFYLDTLRRRYDGLTRCC